MGRLSILIAVVLVLTAGCGGDGPGADEPGPTTSTTTTSTTSSPDGATDSLEIRRFEVAGAEVWTRSALTQLPERATEVAFSGPLIDSGNGPEACLGTVALSMPPQCSGPVVDGFQFGGDWAQTASGVTWGDRNIVVSWPPVDGRLQLVSDPPFDPLPFDDEWDDSLPAECEAIDRFVDVEVLAQWADRNPDRSGVVSVVESGRIGVLSVKGDLEAVREELSNGGASPCLVSVDYSTAELEAQQLRIGDLSGADVYLTVIASGSIDNRVIVGFAVADLQAVRAILELVDDPGIVRITGEGQILAGN